MVKYIPKSTGIQGVFSHKFSRAGVLLSKTPMHKKRPPRVFFYAPSPRGVAFQSQTSCLLLPGRLRAPRYVLYRLFLLQCLRIEFFQSLPPVTVIELEGNLLGGTPHRIFCLDTLNVSRAVSKRGSTPLITIVTWSFARQNSNA